MLIEGPVDKLDVRIPRGTKLVNDLARALRTTGHSNPLTNSFDTSIPGSAIREARHYIQSHDLRLFGLSSILFFGNKCSGNHKLKIVGTGTMSLSRIVSEIKSAFEPEF